MDLSNLERTLATEPKYRLLQARDFVFHKFIDNWDNVTSFPKGLREKLNKECPLEIKVKSLFSKDKTGFAEASAVKTKIKLKDGAEIESVLMRHKDGRNTVCVSCQVGCPMNCAFCATGKMGFVRNLSVDEIIEQVTFFFRYLKNAPRPDLGEIPRGRVSGTNVTFMGMGEPFLNYDNVMQAIKILNHKNYFGIGIRNISISTCGVVEGIEKLANSGLQVNLAISLHSPDNKLRSELMPINKKYPLENVLNAVDNYIKKTKRKVMFEYVLINGINDTKECANELAKLMRHKLYFLNLIVFNPVPNSKFQPSTTKRIAEFKRILKDYGVNFVQRYKFGQDIKAACGQFVTKNKQKMA